MEFNDLVSHNNLLDCIGLPFIGFFGPNGFVDHNGLVSVIGIGLVGFIGISLVSLVGFIGPIRLVGLNGFSLQPHQPCWLDVKRKIKSVSLYVVHCPWSVVRRP